MEVFGAIGKIGSGKDAAATYIGSKYDMATISVGDIVREMAGDRGLEPTRQNLEHISSSSIRENGEDYFMRLVLDTIWRNGWEQVALSGIRTPADVRYLKQKLKGDFVLFHVYVRSSQIRYERLKRRKRPGDPDSYDEFLEQEKNEEKRFHLEQACSMADYLLDNSRTLADLHAQIDELMAAQMSKEELS